MKKLPLLCSLFLSLLLLIPIRAENPALDSPTPAPLSAPTADSARPAPIDPAKAAEIRKLLALTGTVKMTNQVLTQMLAGFRAQNSTVSAEFWDRVQKEMDTAGLVEKIVPLYDKYYTLEDLQAINGFYASPAGQKVLSVTPRLMHDSMQIGQQWGRAMGLRIMEELKAEKDKENASVAPPTPPATPAPAAH